MRTVFRVSPDADGHGWIVMRDGTGIGVFMVRRDAVTRAVVQAKVAKPSRVVILAPDGAVESERYYGADPAPPSEY